MIIGGGGRTGPLNDRTMKVGAFCDSISWIGILCILCRLLFAAAFYEMVHLSTQEAAAVLVAFGVRQAQLITTRVMSVVEMTI